MIDLSPEWITILMFAAILIGILLGYPLAIVLAGVATITGILIEGPQVFSMFRLRMHGIMSNYIFLAVPLFIFMGNMVERTGAAEKMFNALHLWLGGIRGGLAIATIIIGTILAACVGVIAASVVMLALIAIPSMLKRGYSKSLTCGAVCAGGSLGILIPPSIMLVIYGPTASLSVGKLFMAAFMPGFLLSALYIAYIVLRCKFNPELAPPLSKDERAVPLRKKLNMLVTSLLPPLFLILAVLGSIFFGIAAPTEAAALGALASVILALAFRSLDFQALKEITYTTMRVTCMVVLIAFGATMFTGVFLSLGCGDVLSDLIISVPFGRWGSFGVIMLIVFILGMFIDWIGIIFILVPLVTPMADVLGFHPIWFAMMFIINLQFSFITPPFSYALFYLKGIAKDEWELSINDIINGIIPYLGLIAIGLGLCIVFPQIVLWLPRIMVK
jgi:tripartite ATP-independent transporter DctM subunit